MRRMYVWASNPLAVASGAYGVRGVNKFGRNADIDTASGYEAIWNGGGSYTGHEAIAAETVEVFSSDANDASAGTGARTVQVYGLDASWDEQNEIVTLDGVTAVDTAGTYIRLDRMIVRSAGSGAENAGSITARQKTTTANIFAVLPAGYNQTMIAAYTIPNGYEAYVHDWYVTLGGANGSDVAARLRARPFGEVFQVKEEIGIKGVGSSSQQRIYRIPKGPFAEKTDICIQASSDANNTVVAAGFGLILVPTE